MKTHILLFCWYDKDGILVDDSFCEAGDIDKLLETVPENSKVFMPGGAPSFNQYENKYINYYRIIEVEMLT